MTTADFEAILKRAIGLDAASIGSSAVDRAVQERLAATGLGDAAAYGDLLRSSADEVQELVEAIVVPETWFFRDREAFVALARIAFEEWLRTHAEGVFRIASIPCSTGEEPYSVAMALVDAGFPADRFRIDAIDISRRALERAGRAVFGKNSFRGGDLAFRDRHFAAVPRGWQLAAAVAGKVQFHPGNLLDPMLLAGSGPYDVIFCRNVLIYFDRPTQDRAVAVLAGLLAAKGFLFVGPSETGLMLSHGFDSAKLPLAFAFRKPGTLPREPKTDGATPLRRPRAAPPATLPKKNRPARSVAILPAVAPVTASHQLAVSSPSDPLDAIARLADQGHLAEAARQCEEFLRAQRPTARAFYLLGLIRDAAGLHSDAAALYRKALYLEPNHPETLVHLACLLEKKGDAAGAKILTARARRVGEKAKTA